MNDRGQLDGAENQFTPVTIGVIAIIGIFVFDWVQTNISQISNWANSVFFPFFVEIWLILVMVVLASLLISIPRRIDPEEDRNR